MIRQDDVESGARPLYPMMLESPQLRWAFIRKVYSIIAIQLVLTVAVTFVVVFCHPVSKFFGTTTAGIAVFTVLFLTPFIVVVPLYYFHRRHPVNHILLAIFTVGVAFTLGMTCLKAGTVIVEAVILTAAVVVSLTFYTFWAARRGHDFSFFGPFLFCELIVFLVFGFIQTLFPIGKISTTIYGCPVSIIFCAYIVYDTGNLIKRHSYDEYIWAAVSLYLDVVILPIECICVCHLC